MESEASQALEGRTIAGKFLIEGLIGRGAMGAVYRARWAALEKTVALKVMHPELARDAAFAARFHREAKAASRLEHPNSVRVLDFGQEPDGLLFLAMEFLAGRDLLGVMTREWPLSDARVTDIMLQTLSALGVAHDLGIVHRDLKPENIMVLAGTDDEGRPADIVKVCDFGIAKLTNDPAAVPSAGASSAKGPLTSSGTLIGTPEYMSPEQGRGDSLDARSDLYSVGVILFHLLTGKVPFRGETAIGTILKHLTDEPPRPASLVPAVDPRLEAICLKAMRKARDERYASAREMRADLRAIRDHARGVAGGVPPPEPSYPDFRVALTVNDVASFPGAGSAPSVEVRPAATAHGVAVTADTRPRRAWVAGVALGAAMLGVALTLAIVTGLGGRAADRGSISARAPTSPASPASAAPPVDLLPLAPAAPPPLVAQGAAPTAAGGGRHVRAGHAASAAPASASAAPATATPPTSGVAAPAAASPSEAPTYDPQAATVDIGAVTPNNLSGDAVRVALRGAPLTRCYRDALRARGRREFGSASLNLSVDETGRIAGAVLTGADWLPEMTRCVQGGAMGLMLRPGAVQAGGGTAEVWLSFRAP